MSFLHSGVGHQSVVDSLVFSPDGRRILSGSWDGTAKLWDAHSGALLRTLFWGGIQVTSVAWSPDGSIVAVACWPPDFPRNESELASYQAYFANRDPSYFDARLEDDEAPTEEVRLFDAASGELIRSIQGQGSGVAFAPNGQSLAVVSWSNLSIYDLASGELTAHYDGIEKAALRNVIYSDDGKLVACVDSNGVMVFDAASASPLYLATDPHLFAGAHEHDDGFRLVVPPDRPEHIAPDEDGAYFSEFWRKTLPGFRPHNSSDGGMKNQRIAFSPDGKLAAIRRDAGFNGPPSYGFSLGGVTILELDSGQTIQFIPSPDQKWLRTTAFSPDGKTLAGTGDLQTIFLWNVETGEEILRIGEPPVPITAVAFAKSKPLVAAGSADGTLLLCNSDKPAVIGLDRQHSSPIAHLEFSDDDETLVVADVNGHVRVCGIASMRPRVEFRPHKGRLLGGMISADGQRFVSVGYDDEPTNRNDHGKPGKVVVSRLSDGEEIAAQTLPDIFRIKSSAASPTRDRLAISYGTLVFTADIAAAIDVRETWNQPNVGIARIAYAPFDQTLLVGNEGYGMSLIATETSTLIRKFTATRDWPTCFAFTHDGKCVARSTAYDRSIELFDVSSGILKRYFLGHQSAVTTLAVSPDDNVLASGGNDGTLKLWNIANGDLEASIVIYPRETNAHPPWECVRT
ncbi:hypothetical protein LOC68_17920 [Blastopirellula sp. JC732]|uniref:Anaphase-promoting complex subunit 4-like WD40 domain-containing protein n=1 Tax=Blastopirellula sediminis TaxID=2894196 RepID=A0A9X1MP02_9BACT|nr:hypothetical protein [Blastopirellula sediminis]MCC9606426.1 hypothetical protein [Blastopirellula sediminis]MCC9630276.1 hypothetical protein [Blastopirellula sediminis]